MRYTRIRITRFGPLVDVDTGEEHALPGLVAVLGPNEAGKSAFHRVLGALLHGFYPANRDQNPFTPWKGGDIEISAELTVDDGERWEVQRRLLSAPRGQLVRGATTEDLGNRTLPGADHVDERVYRQAYAVSLADVAGVEEAAWEAVEDELVVGMGARDFRPPREVVKAFDDEAARLWKPNRRGRQEYRELRTTLRELRSRRREAGERDRALRETEAEVRTLARREEELRTSRTRAQAVLERLRKLAPLRRQLLRLDELEAAVGDREVLEGLPRDPAGRLRELEDRVERMRMEREELAALEARIRAALDDLVPAAEPTSTIEEAEKRFLALPLERLRERVDALEGERRRLLDLEERLKGLETREAETPPPPPRWTLVAVPAGAAALAWGAWTGSGPVVGAGTLVLVAGLLELFGRHGKAVSRIEGENAARRREEEELRARIAEAGGRVARHHADVEELLEPLGLREEVTEKPTSALGVRLGDLIALLRQRETKLRTNSASGPGYDEAERELEEFRRRLAAAGGGADEAGLRAVERRLKDLDALDRLREDLKGEAGDPEALRRRIHEVENEGESWSRIPDRLAEEEGRLKDAERELQEIGREAGRLRERAKGLAAEETVDLVDGRILEVEAELERVARERDRAFVLARLLERAEGRFREENQPELLRRAEDHLGAFTGGRYRRILLDGEGGATGLRLHASHLPGPLPVAEPLSTGTREQVYVALRLAIVDHLDQGRETLPVLLDEVLVNWDPQRRAEALDVLAGLADRRQVFLFTCHPHLAEEVGERGGAVLTLQAPAEAMP